MTSPRLIVCEKTGRWAALFRRGLARQAAVVAEARGLADCGRQLADSPASVIAVETTEANLDTVTSSLVVWSSEFPQARFIALLDRALLPVEMLLREAGALDVLVSPADIPRASRLATQRLALAPPAQLPWREALAARLPWKNWAKAAG